MKRIIVGCVLAALLMVPVAAFAAPSAAVTDDPVVSEQEDVLSTDVVEDGLTSDDTLANANGEQGIEQSSEAMSAGPSALYYIVGGVVIALGVGFYIVLTIKSKRH